VLNFEVSTLKIKANAPIKDIIKNVTKMGLFRPILVAFLEMSLKIFVFDAKGLKICYDMSIQPCSLK